MSDSCFDLCYNVGPNNTHVLRANVGTFVVCNFEQIQDNIITIRSWNLIYIYIYIYIGKLNNNCYEVATQWAASSKPTFSSMQGGVGHVQQKNEAEACMCMSCWNKAEDATRVYILGPCNSENQRYATLNSNNYVFPLKHVVVTGATRQGVTGATRQGVTGATKHVCNNFS